MKFTSATAAALSAIAVASAQNVTIPRTTGPNVAPVLNSTIPLRNIIPPPRPIEVEAIPAPLRVPVSGSPVEGRPIAASQGMPALERPVIGARPVAVPERVPALEVPVAARPIAVPQRAPDSFIPASPLGAAPARPSTFNTVVRSTVRAPVYPTSTASANLPLDYGINTQRQSATRPVYTPSPPLRNIISPRPVLNGTLAYNGGNGTMAYNPYIRNSTTGDHLYTVPLRDTTNRTIAGVQFNTHREYYHSGTDIGVVNVTSIETNSDSNDNPNNEVGTNLADDVDESPLEVEIAQGPGGPYNVQVRIENRGNQDLWVLRYGLLDESGSLTEDHFVGLGQYRGPRVNSNFRDLEVPVDDTSFIYLPAGSEIVTAFDLSDYYSVSFTAQPADSNSTNLIYARGFIPYVPVELAPESILSVCDLLALRFTTPFFTIGTAANGTITDSNVFVSAAPYVDINGVASIDNASPSLATPIVHPIPTTTPASQRTVDTAAALSNTTIPRIQPIAAAPISAPIGRGIFRRAASKLKQKRGSRIFPRSNPGTNCGSDSIAAFDAAAGLASNAAAVALTGPDEVLEMYFKSSSTETREFVAEQLLAIAEAAIVNRQGVTFNCEDSLGICGPSDTSYALDAANNLYLCPLFYSLPLSGGSCNGVSQASVALHELSHFSSVGGLSTVDNAYGPACFALSAEQAINNADTYELFALNVANGCA